MWREAFGLTCGIVVIIMAWDGLQSARRIFRKYGVWKGLHFWCFMFFGGIFWVVYTLLTLFCHNQ